MCVRACVRVCVCVCLRATGLGRPARERQRAQSGKREGWSLMKEVCRPVANVSPVRSQTQRVIPRRVRIWYPCWNRELPFLPFFSSSICLISCS